MSETKRYYWLKFQHDFFTSKRIKKLRKLAGGDTFTIIYLKMQLKSLQTNGLLEYTGIEPSFAEEVALDIDEDAENVAVTITYLLSCGLMEEMDNHQYLMTYVPENTGSETAAAQRMRDFRDRKSSESVTLLQQCSNSVTESKRESKSKEIEKEKDTVVRFTPPSAEEVESYCRERGNGINGQEFCDFYESKGWMVGRNKMKEWKACVRTWERGRKERKTEDTHDAYMERWKNL